jgi:hypothetical protein
VGLLALFVAVLIVGISCVNGAMPAAAWARSRDGRFLCLAGANAVLAGLGGLWAWGQLPVHPPWWTAIAWPAEVVVLGVAGLLLAATLLPRRA